MLLLQTMNLHGPIVFTAKCIAYIGVHSYSLKINKIKSSEQIVLKISNNVYEISASKKFWNK